MAELQELFDQWESQRSTSSGDRFEQRKNEWLTDLNELVALIEKWLEPGRERGILHFKRSIVPLDEPDLGQYEAPGLEVHLLAPQSRRLFLEPKGEQIIGVIPPTDPSQPRKRLEPIQGRVDLTSGAARAMFVRGGDRTWRIQGTTPGSPMRPLSEALFAETLRELVEA